jgi:hypothetical protein
MAVQTRKKELLYAVYRVYDEVAGRFSSACSRDCSACCTVNVIATSLEVEALLESLGESLLRVFVDQAVRAPTDNILRPAITINELARHCLERREPPREPESFHIGPCPFRNAFGCPCYDVRPFGCRALWSEELCSERGEAIMNPLLLTINGLFQQIIEHIDQGGIQGNMLDLVRVIKSETTRDGSHSHSSNPHTERLLRNAPNPGFIVPPDHRHEAAEIINRLRREPVGPGTFWEVLNERPESAPDS